MFQRCLICTDFSDGLQRLVKFVDSLAAGGLKQIVFLHNVPLWEEGEIPRIDDEEILKARDRLEGSLQEIPDGVEVHIETPSGRLTDNIRKVAQKHHTELILMGTPSRSLLQETLFGSATAELARVCATPLLILRPQLVSVYTREELDLRCQHLFRHLLIPYNGSDASGELVGRVKLGMQNQPGSSLRQCLLLWVVEEGGRREIPKDYQLQEAREKLEPVKAELEQLGLQVDTEVCIGDPFTEILQATSTFDISAVAIASDHLGNLFEWPVRSFAGELMRRLWHPVLFFPQQRA